MMFWKKMASSIFAALAVSAWAAAAWAGAPNVMTYQGTLQELGTAVTGNRNVEVALCTDFLTGACTSTASRACPSTAGCSGRLSPSLPGSI